MLWLILSMIIFAAMVGLADYMLTDKDSKPTTTPKVEIDIENLESVRELAQSLCLDEEAVVQLLKK